jgi:hypothetical protein
MDEVVLMHQEIQNMHPITIMTGLGTSVLYTDYKGVWYSKPAPFSPGSHGT